MANDSFKISKSLNIEPKSSPTLNAEGDIGMNSTSHKLELRDDSATRSVVTEDGTATLTNKTIDADSNTITNIENADIKAAAAIALNKLAATTASRALASDASGFVTASATTATELGYVSGVTSAIQTQLDGKQATGSYITASSSDTLTNKTFDADGTGNSISNIENENIKAAAAIALNKLAATTASRALASDGSGFVTASATTATELGYVSGVTSAIQTQINALASGASSSIEVTNLGIATSVAASALTIAIKQADGSTDPSTGASAVKVGMRSSTLTSGAYNQRSITSALSLVISSGSTLGQASGQPSNIYVYLIDNAGTLELAASGTRYPEMGVISTTAEGGAGAADSRTVVYSTTARTDVPYRLIAAITNTQATAGTWASAGTVLAVGNFSSLRKRTTPTIQTFTSSSGTYNTPEGVTYLRVRMVGAGGGGGGAGSTGGTSGGAGGDTTFGSMTAGGGGGGGRANGGSASGGTGGTFSGTIIGTSLNGAKGNGNWATQIGTVVFGGIAGPGTPFGGGGGGMDYTGANGANAPDNTGSGGPGGGAASSNAYSGASGGAGAFIDAILTDPAATYSYAVGAAGTAGTAGTGGGGGGGGGSGYIEVTEYYT